jgi:hypothetical protein
MKPFTGSFSVFITNSRIVAIKDALRTAVLSRKQGPAGLEYNFAAFCDLDPENISAPALPVPGGSAHRFS